MTESNRIPYAPRWPLNAVSLLGFESDGENKAIKSFQAKGLVLRSRACLCQQCSEANCVFCFAIPITAGDRCFLSSSLFWENKTAQNSWELPLVLKVTPLLFAPDSVKPENG